MWFIAVLRYMESSCLMACALSDHMTRSRERMKVQAWTCCRQNGWRCPAVTVTDRISQTRINRVPELHLRALPTFHFTVSTSRHIRHPSFTFPLCTCQSFFFACTRDHHFAYYSASFAYLQHTHNQFIHHPILPLKHSIQSAFLLLPHTMW